MAKPKVRLSTLALLIVIIALSLALFIQRRRDAPLRAEVARLETQLDDLERTLQQSRVNEVRTAIWAQKEIDALRKTEDDLKAELARLRGQLATTDPEEAGPEFHDDQ